MVNINVLLLFTRGVSWLFKTAKYKRWHRIGADDSIRLFISASSSSGSMHRSISSHTLKRTISLRSM